MVTKVRRRTVIVTGIAVTGVVAGIGIAYAEIPYQGVITTCYLKSGGQLRVIDETTGKCSSRETKLQWNVQGAQGPQGEQGEQGPAGPVGVSGYEIVRESDEVEESFGGGTTKAFALSVDCPTGKKVLGGGASGSITANNPDRVIGVGDVMESWPFEFDDQVGWAASIGKADGSFFAQGEGVAYTIYAICANVDG